MTDRDDENMVDPPEGGGGTGKAEPESTSNDSTAVDPPSSDGGTTA